MREILAINPKRRKPAKRRRKGAVKMARKRKSTKRRTTRRKARRNPSSKTRRVARSAGGRMLSGLSIKTALKDQVPIQIGMLAAKWATKRFGMEASDVDPASWNWASHVKGGLGAVVAGMVANMIKPGMGQKVLTGGLAEVFRNVIRYELIEKSPFALAQFGEGDEAIVVDSDGTPYASDGMGEYLPMTEDYRMVPEMQGYGDSLVTPGPLGMLEPVGPLGADDFSEYARVYR